MDRVMLDLETLGTEPGCAVLSIGAVRFDVDGVGAQFYRNVDLASCESAGLGIDAETLEWWLDQDEEVTDVLTGGDDLDRALHEFTTFYGDASEIWAYSPSFDCEILEAAYRAVGRSAPWNFYEERDARTVDELIDVDVEREGPEHDALADAVFQAEKVRQALFRIEGDDA